MANYTAADIKALREKTAAGMMDVKKALDEADGDMGRAEEILRVKGLKGVTKREGRTASNGLVTASAAGLLNIVETAPYGVTKHAAVAIAEWLRIAYGRRGLRVSCLCPQSVQTDMTRDGTGSAGVAFSHGFRDDEFIPRDVMLQAIGEMARAVDVPVTADILSGLGDTPEAVAGTIREVIALGAVGVNIEDGSDIGGPHLVDVELHCDKIRAACEAARQAGVKRVVFASSNHAVGFYRRKRKIGTDVTVRPDSRYGVSKAFGEALGEFARRQRRFGGR